MAVQESNSPPEPHSGIIEVIGAPVDHGGAGAGASGGPHALRAAGVTTLEGRKVVDAGDVPVDDLPHGTTIRRGPDPESRRPEWGPLRTMCTSLHERCRDAVASGSIPLVLGGDHTLAAGSMSGVATGWCRRHDAIVPEDAPSLGLLWFDAHADLNTPDTTPSGNPHGMPAAALLGHRVAPLDDVVGETGVFDPRRTVFLGARDMDPGEMARVSAAPSSSLPLLLDGDTFRHETPDAIAERVMERIAPDGGAFALSFDLDVIDPAEAPGVNLAVADGLRIEQVMRVLERLAAHGGCIAMDIVELDPTADIDGRTAKIGVEAARAMFGSS